MNDITQNKVWFITGSQHMYGKETLDQVVSNASQIVNGLNQSSDIPVQLVFKQNMTTPEEIYAVCLQANNSPECIGIVFWMHTFSPAKMWIRGLQALNKPICHLHTQFNAEIPWGTIDMDFMNLNQSAHGDREFGHMLTRLNINRKIIAGHWQDQNIHQEIGDWTRACLGWYELQHLKVARIGDNMRDVAVTEGDKVAAQMKMGFSVNAYGLSDLETHVDDVSDKEVELLLEEYASSYNMSEALLSNGNKRSSLKDAARIEIGLRSFLDSGNFKAFTDTFENLGNLKQLPGIAVQRLMADGYGFAAEGDWKTSALLRCIKVMGTGMKGGSSFMEDYTYHFTQDKSYVLGSHMLEICPSIAAHTPTCEVHPLGIGGKEDPVRLIFNGKAGNSINASLIDVGSRFRLLVNEVEAVDYDKQMPNLPVAGVLWDPKPNLQISASAWMLAGGAHHTVFSQTIKTTHLEDLAEMLGIELLVIDQDTTVREFKQTLKTNSVYYHLNQPI